MVFCFLNFIPTIERTRAILGRSLRKKVFFFTVVKYGDEIDLLYASSPFWGMVCFFRYFLMAFLIFTPTTLCRLFKAETSNFTRSLQLLDSFLRPALKQSTARALNSLS